LSQNRGIRRKAEGRTGVKGRAGGKRDMRNLTGRIL